MGMADGGCRECGGPLPPASDTAVGTNAVAFVSCFAARGSMSVLLTTLANSASNGSLPTFSITPVL